MTQTTTSTMKIQMMILVSIPVLAITAAMLPVATAFVVGINPTSFSRPRTTTYAAVPDQNSLGGVQVAQLVHPSVALVRPIGVRNMTARGSGFVIDWNNDQDKNNTNTYLLTAAHVAAPGWQLDVSFDDDSNNTSYSATVIGRNDTLDLALIRLQNNNNESLENNHFKALTLASSIPPVGSVVFCNGHPAAQLITGPAMTCGILCGVAQGVGIPDSMDDPRRTNSNLPQGKTEFIVTDAAMSGGMSGGPLVDATTGHVIGMNALIRPDLRALGNYAVSVTEIQSFLESLRTTTAAADTTASSSTTSTTTSATNKSQMFQVVLFNDPMNKRARIEGILMEVAEQDKANANAVMMKAHTTGRGTIAAFDTQDQADALCQRLRQQDVLVEVVAVVGEAINA
jgi:S1-C subfamily serine protease